MERHKERKKGRKTKEKERNWYGLPKCAATSFLQIYLLTIIGLRNNVLVFFFF